MRPPVTARPKKKETIWSDMEESPVIILDVVWLIPVVEVIMWVWNEL